MLCPSCGNPESKVIDSRPYNDNTEIKRRRECLECGCRFSTYERIVSRPIIVIKADGSSEVFDREKILRGLLIACAKRPVSSQSMNELIDDIEVEVRAYPKHEVSSKRLGDMVLARLIELDEVAYIRFASVYKDFKSVEEFMDALKELRK